MKASITIHIETLWANQAEVNVEADLSDVPSEADHEVVSAMFEKARLMSDEALGESERGLFGQEAVNSLYRELDEREARLDERDNLLTAREGASRLRRALADRREANADVREREQMEHGVHAERGE